MMKKNPLKNTEPVKKKIYKRKLQLDPFRKGIRKSKNAKGDSQFVKYDGNRRIVMDVVVRYYPSVKSYMVRARARNQKEVYNQFFPKKSEALKVARKLLK